MEKIKQKMKTSIAYASNLLVTGAISETSRNAELEICKHVSREENQVFVEFGMGHGNITREILKTISPTSKLYAFEVKKSFCEHVRESIPDKRLIIINDGAENLKLHVNEPLSAVLSSIPFSFFSNKKGLQIIRDAYDTLEDNRYFSQVLYTKFNFKKFQQIFEDCHMKTNKKTITEYIYHCKKTITN